MYSYRGEYAGTGTLPVNISSNSSVMRDMNVIATRSDFPPEPDMRDSKQLFFIVSFHEEVKKGDGFAKAQDAVKRTYPKYSMHTKGKNRVIFTDIPSFLYIQLSNRLNMLLEDTPSRIMKPYHDQISSYEGSVPVVADLEGKVHVSYDILDTHMNWKSSLLPDILIHKLDGLSLSERISSHARFERAKEIESLPKHCPLYEKKQGKGEFGIHFLLDNNSVSELASSTLQLSPGIYITDNNEEFLLDATLELEACGDCGNGYLVPLGYRRRH